MLVRVDSAKHWDYVEYIEFNTVEDLVDFCNEVGNNILFSPPKPDQLERRPDIGAYILIHDDYLY